ncbi:ABC transporter permease [Couchioplanes caeruleus]|uniref:ABC transporter permease n=1 Tax=Couchioplanes caeruleus TaxID=56438 RepID=UPI0020BFC5EA|nr:ABC transporter permease [Couchioplanes caeruleus]UQU67682.1 ABC transporter permease [Couchioplanes caeruleus]
MTSIATASDHEAPEAAEAPRPRRAGPARAVRQSATVAWRQLVQIKRNPEQLVEVGIQPLMFVFLFAFVLAGQLAGSRQAYMLYVVPGLMVQSAVLVSARTAIGINTDVTTGIFDRLRSLPISRVAPLLGRMLADYVMLLWSVLILVVAGTALGFRVHTHWFMLAPVCLLLLLFMLAFSWAAVYLGLLASSPESVQALAFGLMLPLTFLSGAYVRVETMPGWLQAVVKVNPVSSLADAIRGMLVGGPVSGPVTQTLISCAVLTVVFAPLALMAYRRER